jgi:hypothetical protein
MFRESNFCPACDEVAVKRPAGPNCTHRNGQRLRTHGRPDYDAYHLESARSTFGTVESFIFVSGRCQTDRNPTPQVPSLGSLGLGSAFGIKSQVIGCA